jgi:CRISPR-associated endoribonuclease Cas6
MLQRVNIKLKTKQNMLLQYDYNYQIGCELYKKINITDEAFGSLYHKEGLRKDRDQRNFKLLNPLLQFNKVTMDKEGIILNKDDIVTLTIGGSKQVINKILNGFYQDNNLNIDGKMFEFVNAEISKMPQFKQIGLYKVESALIEAIQDENRKIEYLDIMNPRYIQAVKQNLKRKYQLVYGKEYSGDLKIGIEDFLKIKSKSVNIKGHKVHGYGKFNVLIQAEKDMQKVAYCCGLGSHNMYGAGFLKYIIGGEANGQNL